MTDPNRLNELTDGLNNMSLQEGINEIQVANNFESFIYTDIIDEVTLENSSEVKSLDLKHALNIQSESSIVSVNQEKGYFTDTNQRGLCFLGKEYRKPIKLS